MSTKMKLELPSTKKDIYDLRIDVRKMEKRLMKKINMVIDYFDKGNIDLEKRVTKIENHLGFT